MLHLSVPITINQFQMNIPTIFRYTHAHTRAYVHTRRKHIRTITPLCIVHCKSSNEVVLQDSMLRPRLVGALCIISLQIVSVVTVVAVSHQADFNIKNGKFS